MSALTGWMSEVRGVTMSLTWVEVALLISPMFPEKDVLRTSTNSTLVLRSTLTVPRLLTILLWVDWT